MRNPKLNLLLATEIRRRVAAGEQQKALAAEFGVKPPAVNAVVHGRLYPDQPRPRPARQPTPARPRQLTQNATRVLAILRGRSSAVSKQEVAETLGVSPEVAGSALRTLRLGGLVEKVGMWAETRYRLTRPAQALSAPRGDRPRSLGLRAAWLRQYGPPPEGLQEA